MDFLKRLDLKPALIAKIVVVGVIGITLLVVVANVFSTTFGRGTSQSPLLGGIGFATDSFGGSPAYNGVVAESAVKDMDYALSPRNISPMPPTGTTGSDAEQFEVTSYSATVETRKLESDCGMILGLKSRGYVIFESANEYDHGCNYTFKVERDHVSEILAVINSLDPKDLSENTYTIKNQIEDFTSELDILNKKKQSIEATLEDAIKAYDQLTSLATDVRDVETLAKIIESKIRIIEQLTRERISVNEQIDRLGRAKAEQLDRLEYTYFYVNIYESKFIDGEELADSWKAAIKQSVRDFSQILQQLTVGLVVVLLLAAQYVLYAFIILIIAKLSWKWGKKLWKK